MQTSIRTQSYSVAHPLHSGWQNELGTGCTVLDPPRQRQDWQVCRQPPDSRRQGKERPRGSEQDEYSPKRRSCYSLMYYAVAKNIFCLVIITMLVFFLLQVLLPSWLSHVAAWPSPSGRRRTGRRRGWGGRVRTWRRRRRRWRTKWEASKSTLLVISTTPPPDISLEHVLVVLYYPTNNGLLINFQLSSKKGGVC